jgi:hypothetical protein
VLYRYTVQTWTGAELELICLCGFENFERVVVRRKPHDPIVTDFVACVGCRAMYFAPISLADAPPAGPGDNMGAIGGPEPDSAAALKRDAAEAALDYRKPRRSGRR